MCHIHHLITHMACFSNGPRKKKPPGLRPAVSSFRVDYRMRRRMISLGRRSAIPSRASSAPTAPAAPVGPPPVLAKVPTFAPWFPAPAADAVVSLAVVAAFSELPEPALDSAEPAEACVSMLVLAADWPLTGALVSAVSLAVAAPFSELPEPALDAAEPAEACVSMLVVAADWPVTGARGSAVSWAVGA